MRMYIEKRLCDHAISSAAECFFVGMESFCGLMYIILYFYFVDLNFYISTQCVSSSQLNSFTGPQNPESKAQTNLIVNYLPPTMTEDEVRNLFVTVGPIQSCKVIKEKLTQASLGYAFINYTNPGDAEKAIQSLNGLPLQNKTIKVSYARPSSSTIKNANLYVAYLPKNYTQTELEALFRPFGNIITSKILIDTATGLSRGVGFVRFDKHTEADNAILALNGKLLPGCTQPILVKFANQAKPSSNQQSVATTAAISGIAALSRRGNTAFNPSGAGGPMRHTLAPNVRFNPVSAVTPGGISLAALTSIASAPSGTQGFCVFVYNLPENTQDSLLYQLFSPFGAIASVKVIKDTTGKCKRYGFVNMITYEEAYSAIVALNGYEVDGRSLQVSFKTQKE